MTIVTLAPLQHSRAPLREAIIGALRSALETGQRARGDRLVERRLDGAQYPVLSRRHSA